MSIRHALVRDGAVRDYLLTDAEPTPRDFIARTWGDGAPELDPEAQPEGWQPRDMAAEGAWIRCPDGLPVGEGWTHDGAAFHLPAPPPGVRVVTGAEFTMLFTPQEVAALMQVPECAQAALLAASQNSVNLDSPRFVALMDLAVARGALTPQRAAAVKAGRAP